MFMQLFSQPLPRYSTRQIELARKLKNELAKHFGDPLFDLYPLATQILILAGMTCYDLVRIPERSSDDWCGLEDPWPAEIGFEEEILEEAGIRTDFRIERGRASQLLCKIQRVMIDWEEFTENICTEDRLMGELLVDQTASILRVFKKKPVCGDREGAWSAVGKWLAVEERQRMQQYWDGRFSALAKEIEGVLYVESMLIG